MFKKAMIAGAVALVSVGANAATANLTVTGTITPEACAIALTGGGLVDYGSLSSQTVKGYGSYYGTDYAAPAKTIGLAVTCSAPTAVSLAWTDNRASSKMAFDAYDAVRFGLGLSGSAKIGAYALAFGQDGGSTTYVATTGGAATAPAGYLVRPKGSVAGTAWAAPTGLDGGYFNPANSVGIKHAAADTAPPALVAWNSTVSVGALFNKALVDTATSVITLDGSATVAVEYI